MALKLKWVPKKRENFGLNLKRTRKSKTLGVEARIGNTGDGEDEFDDHPGARESVNLEISALTRQKSLHGRKLATVDSTEVRAAVLLDKRNAKSSKRMTDMKLNKQSGMFSPAMSES